MVCRTTSVASSWLHTRPRSSRRTPLSSSGSARSRHHHRLWSLLVRSAVLGLQHRGVVLLRDCIVGGWRGLFVVCDLWFVVCGLCLCLCFVCLALVALLSLFLSLIAWGGGRHCLTTRSTE